MSATAGIVALVVAGRSDAPPEGDRLFPGATFVRSYRITYAIEEFDAEPRVEERLVERPYSSKVVSSRGGAVLAGSITNERGRWALVDDGSGWQLRAAGRQRPADDPQPIEALAAAVADGRAVRRGTDRVLGRTCTVVRTGAPLGAALARPTASEHADLCVDPTGVVLRERWMVRGTLARSMVATSFVPDAAIDGAEFDAVPEVESPPEGAPGVAVVRPLAAGESLPVELRGVAGYRADGPPVAVERSLGGSGSGLTYSQNFVRGARLIVVQQGPVPPGFSPRSRIDLGLNSSELTVVVGDVVVRLRGVELAALEAFGRDAAGGRSR